MNPFSLGLMAFSTMYSMKAANDQAAMQKEQYEQARKDAILEGRERHNAAISNMSVHLSANNAMSGFISVTCNWVIRRSNLVSGYVIKYIGF